ncbi:MAG: YjgN family protein [Methylotenera sp.]
MEITNQNTASQKTTPIIFEGKTSEYFGIWIVNLLLTLVTFGIYSAWAKVRRKKYFYNNTLIDNVGFDYHAKPTAILKGRMIAFLFLLGYSTSANINPILPAIFMLILFAALPWLVVRGSLFNSRNTSHRGLRFDFVGTVGQAAKVFIGLPMLLVPTLGLIMPYNAHQKNQFLMNNHRFGLSQFNMQAKVKEFYKVYLMVMILPAIFIIGIIAAIAIPAYQSYVNKAKAASHAELAMPAGVAAFATVKQQPQIVLAANETTVETYKVERVYSDKNPPEVQLEAAAAAQSTEQAADTALPAEQVQQSVEELQAAPAAQEEAVVEEKTLEEIMQEREQQKQDKMREWMQNPSAMLFGALGVLVYLLFIFGFLGYMQARIGNLVWNNTTLDNLSFKSSLRARDFIWLYFTNILAIMLTFGLATPWAQVRMAKYRASKLQVVGDVDFDQFVGDKKAEVKATGEEIADMFDVDLSFG